MENEKNTPDKCQTEVDDGDNVFLDNRYLSHNEGVSSTKHHHQVPPTYSQFLFDPRDIRFHSTGSGSHRRTPSYDSRESTKSVSECSYVSGSPCESPRFHEMSLSSFSVASSAPTAPPDENPFHSEKDFVNYLLTLPPASAKPEMTSLDLQISTKSTSGGQFHQGSPPQIGLNHLENLCKLMEQLGELREHNSKLQQRVQYLEEMRNLNEIRQNLKEVLEEAIATSPRVVGNEQHNMFDFPTAKDEGDKNEAKRSASSAVKMRPSNRKRLVKQKKGRSQSMGDDDIAFGKHAIPTFQKAKVSKWTKVKEALKWERVQAEPNDSQTMVSKATVTLKPQTTPKEAAGEEILKQKPNQPVKYLQKTDTMREIIVSSNPTTTPEVCDPTPPTTKHYCEDSESSADDELIDLTDPSNKRRSLGSNVVFDDRSPADNSKAPTTKPKLVKESAVTDDDQVKLRKGRSLERGAARTSQMEKENKKLSKGAWGKVKTILQTRKDSLRRKQRKSACLDANPESGLSEGNPNEADEVWIEGADDRVTGSEVESHRSKSKHSSSSSNYGLDEPSSERVPSRSGTVKKVPPQLVIDIQTESECNLKGSDKAESSPTFQQPASCRGKKKGGREDERLSGCQSVPASPSNIASFRYDDLDFLEEYFRENKDGNEQMEVRVRDRLSLAERDSHHHQPVLFNLETIRNLEVMQRNVTEDFTKKMQDWERLKSSYNAQKQQGTAPGPNQLQSSPHFDRKASSSFSGHRFRKTSKDKPALDREQQKEEKHREKELQWLEKQLQKIEREKQRLAKERQKYLERESQLEKMRETMLVKPGSKNKKEVLVKTSAGEFRFEGISKTFTRKLHEWETMKGIGPEVSTLTLLGGQKPKLAVSRHVSSRPSDITAAKKGPNNSLAPPTNGNRLTERNRSHSESSLANMANVQTSTTSLVMRPTDDDYNNDSELYIDTDSSSINALSCSRVNSEPEIAFGGVTGDEVPCAIEVEQMHIEESLPCLEIHSYHVEKPVYSYAPVEVTQLIDSSSGSDAEKEVQIIEARDDEEISKHDTNESFKFDESRVTQIKSPKSSIKNQDGSKIKVLEEVPKNKSAEERLKKKEGVNKVKEISAELMHQAKTLEQTLMDKNVTIRQLQWELLQREMSSKRFQSQLEQGLLSELASPTSKAKSSHQRSWSAAETIGNKREIENQSALNVLKKSDNAGVTPIGLAQKVDELKSELNNLWSSQESTTNSICPEIGAENVQWNKNQFKSNEKAGFNYHQPQQLNGTKNVNESETHDEALNQKTESALKSVIIRRVSDTNVPQHPVSRISKLPMSPQMTRSKSLSQSVTPTSVRKMVQAVSPFPLPEIASPKIPSKNPVTGSPYNLQRQTQVPEVMSGRNGVKLNRQKRLESNKDACHMVLRRQNAEDFQSSSDTDSESSNGVTVTINLNKSRHAKSSFKDSPSLIKNSFSPKLRTPSSPKVSSNGATWRKNSKDEEIVSQTESDERVSAPSTPIVRSRSTRKLKPPSVSKPATGETSTAISDTSSPLNNRRFGCKDNTAPNVRLMIEKFNKKVNEVQTYTSSSPNMSRNRSIGNETASPGVKKSTSFTDSATNFENDCSKFGYSLTQNPLNYKHVVKSASASVIDGETYKTIISKPPLSPEIARKKASNPSLQPVGIASRIPRCLTAISEQENLTPKSPPTAHKATILPDVTHSPTFGIRALEIKRAKENFLSKNPTTHPSGWRSLYQRADQASGATAIEAEVTERGMKPKSILKHKHPCETIDTSSYDPASDTSEEVHVRRGSMSELTEIDEHFSNQITKSASAGAVDFATNFSKSRIPSQTSTDSSDKQQKSTCGLFNFKFRRPKLRHKKTEEILPAVKALCRQSLLVDIDTEVPQGSVPNASNSCPSSPQIKSRQNSTKDSSDLAQYKLKSIFKSK